MCLPGIIQLPISVVNNFTEPVTLRPDKTLRQDNPSMWADTYYVDPFKVRVNELTPVPADTQVNNTQSSTVPSTSSTGQDVPDVEPPSDQTAAKRRSPGRFT